MKLKVQTPLDQDTLRISHHDIWDGSSCATKGLN